MKALEEYRLSKRTGCALENTKVDLDLYYSPWIDIVRNAPKHLKQFSLRNAIDQMAVLSTTSLHCHEDLRLAHLLLSLLSSAYVWQDKSKPSQYIPECLAVPFVDVSQKLGLKPIICYSSVGLANWIYRPFFDHSRKVTYDDFDVIYRLVDSSDWDAFFKVAYQIEFEFAPALSEVLLAVESSQMESHNDLENSLNSITEIMLKITSIMSEFHQRMSVDIFYTEIRPFLQGWSTGSSKHPNGMAYEGTGLKNQYFAGASNAQSLIIQVMDALLGMIYSQKASQEFLEEMLNYMIREHREFILDIKRESCVREFVKTSGSESLAATYNRCIEAVSNFRSYHIQIVTKYILIPSRKKSPLGTGGTDLMPFLKNIRDETDAMKL